MPTIPNGDSQEFGRRNPYETDRSLAGCSCNGGRALSPPWGLHLDKPLKRPPRSSESKFPPIPRLEVDLRGPRSRQPQRFARHSGQRCMMKAYREGTLSFPDGTIIARLAWNYVPSEENNKVFGRFQSFVAGSATVFSLWSRTQRNTPRRAVGFAQFKGRQT